MRKFPGTVLKKWQLVETFWDCPEISEKVSFAMHLTIRFRTVPFCPKTKDGQSLESSYKLQFFFLLTYLNVNQRFAFLCLLWYNSPISNFIYLFE